MPTETINFHIQLPVFGMDAAPRAALSIELIVKEAKGSIVFAGEIDGVTLRMRDEIFPTAMPQWELFEGPAP